MTLSWECNCGNIEYSKELPEECPSCLALESFVQLPEELIKEREENVAQELSILKTNPKKRITLKKTKVKRKKRI
jgi:hypothetical protein